MHLLGEFVADRSSPFYTFHFVYSLFLLYTPCVYKESQLLILQFQLAFIFSSYDNLGVVIEYSQTLTPTLCECDRHDNIIFPHTVQL